MTRSPSLSLAPSALVQLDSACALFSKAAKEFRAEKCLVGSSLELLMNVINDRRRVTGNHGKTT